MCRQPALACSQDSARLVHQHTVACRSEYLSQLGRPGSLRANARSQEGPIDGGKVDAEILDGGSDSGANHQTDASHG